MWLMDIKWPICGQVYVTILHTQYVCPEENFITNQNIHIFAIVCVVVVSSKYPVVVERLTVTDKEGSSHAYVAYEQQHCCFVFDVSSVHRFFTYVVY